MFTAIQNALFNYTFALNWKSSLQSTAHTVVVAGMLLTAGCSGGNSGGAKPQDNIVDPNVVTPTPTPRPTPLPLSVKPLSVSPDVVSKDVVSNASHLTPQIVFNKDGAGIATWSVITGNGGTAVYSVFDAVTKTWSPEKSLASSGTYDPHPQVITNGQTFLLAWQRDFNLYAQVFTPGALQPWSRLQQLNDTESRIYNDPIHLATDGNTYLVAWQSPYVYAQLFADGNWLAQPELIGPTDHASGYGPVLDTRRSLVSGGAAGYVAAWYEYGDGNDIRIRANVYRNDMHGWVGAATISNETGYVTDIAMASNNIGLALKWTINPPISSGSWIDTTRVSVFDTRELSAKWNSPTTLSITTEARSYGHSTNSTLAASKFEFATVWAERDNATSAVKLLSSGYSLDETNTAAWRTTAPIAAALYSNNAPAITGSDTGFACVWINDTGLIRAIFSGGVWVVEAPISSEQNIAWSILVTYANQYAVAYSLQTFTAPSTFSNLVYASEFSGSQWTIPTAVLPQHHDGMDNYFQTIHPLVVTGSPAGFWYAAPQNAADAADKISNVVIRRPGSPSETVGKLAVGQYRGSPDAPLLASNSGGDLLVLWPQYDDGYNNLYAAIRHMGIWSTPIQLNVRDPGVYRGGISKKSIRVAANGNTFAVVWSDEFGVNFRSFDGTQWDATPRRTNGNNSQITTYGGALTTYKTGYALTWTQHSSSPLGNIRSVELATIVNNTWIQASAESISTSDSYGAEDTAVAEGQNNVLIIVYQSFNTPGSIKLTSRMRTGDVWMNPVIVSDTYSHDVSYLTLQSAPTGSFALYAQLYTGQLIATILPPNSTSWTTPHESTQYSHAFGSVAGAHGHTSAWFSDYGLEAVQAQTNEWHEIVTVHPDWQAGYSSVSQPRMIEIGDSVLYTWGAMDFLNQTLGLGRLVDGTWTEAFAIGDFGLGPIQRRDPSLARFGEGAALAWVQYDRSVDASVAEIVVQPALF